MERQSIIDSPDMAVFAEQHMATFAVSAVRHDVEGRQLLEGALELRFVIQGQVVLFEVAWNEQLQGPRSDRPVDKDRWWHQVPPNGFREFVTRHLAAVEATGEVPQRPFPTMWLVDGLHDLAVALDIAQQGRVRTPGHLAQNFDLTLTQDLLGLIVRNRFAIAKR